MDIILDRQNVLERVRYEVEIAPCTLPFYPFVASEPVIATQISRPTRRASAQPPHAHGSEMHAPLTHQKDVAVTDSFARY